MRCGTLNLIEMDTVKIWEKHFGGPTAKVGLDHANFSSFMDELTAEIQSADAAKASELPPPQTSTEQFKGHTPGPWRILRHKRRRASGRICSAQIRPLCVYAELAAFVAY